MNLNSHFLELFYNKSTVSQLSAKTQPECNLVVMKGWRVPDTFCESRLGSLPGHRGSTNTPPVLLKSTRWVVTYQVLGIKAFVGALKHSDSGK